jgi:hypothetical protein
MEKPILTEPGVKYFMNQVLKQCNEKRYVFTNTVFNLVLFLIFILIIGGFLYYKYRGKLTPEEKETKFREQKQDILSRLNSLNVKIDNSRRGNGSSGNTTNLITDLPLWDVSSSDVIVNPYK